MPELNRRQRKLIRIVAIAILILAIVGLLWLGIAIWENSRSQYQGEAHDTQSNETITYQGKTYSYNDDIETVLVMGLDKYSDDADSSSYKNNQQADFVMLIVIDNETKEYSAIHVNRDTMTEINVLGVGGRKISSEVSQLALAYAYGDGDKISCRNTADAVSDLMMDINIDYYVSLKMDAVPVINDLVGGVRVEIMDDFTDIDETLVQGETITLKGQQALNYVRSRYDLEDSTNGRRMERQRQYLNALYNQAKFCAENDEEFIFEAVEKVSGYMVSNCTRLQDIAEKLSEYDFTDIKALNGEAKMGEEFVEFYPDEEALKELVVDVFYKVKE